MGSTKRLAAELAGHLLLTWHGIAAAYEFVSACMLYPVVFVTPGWSRSSVCCPLRHGAVNFA